MRRWHLYQATPLPTEGSAFFPQLKLRLQVPKSKFILLLLFKTTLREKIYEFTSFPSDFIFLGSIFVSSCSQYALTIPILDNAVFPGDRKLKLPFAETPSSQLGKSDYKTALF